MSESCTAPKKEGSFTKHIWCLAMIPTNNKKQFGKKEHCSQEKTKGHLTFVKNDHLGGHKTLWFADSSLGNVPNGGQPPLATRLELQHIVVALKLESGLKKLPIKVNSWTVWMVDEG